MATKLFTIMTTELTHSVRGDDAASAIAALRHLGVKSPIVSISSDDERQIRMVRKGRGHEKVS